MIKRQIPLASTRHNSECSVSYCVLCSPGRARSPRSNGSEGGHRGEGR